MTDVLMAMFAFLIIAMCARSDEASGLGLMLAIVFAVVAVTIWIAGIVIGMAT